MASIAGLVDGEGAQVSEGALDRIASSLSVFDSDGLGVWNGGAVAFVSTPKAGITDGGQEVVVCFEGRLDNREELVELLGEIDRPPVGATDSHLILALATRLGDAFLSRLAGDFALALWRRRDRSLLLARSATGWRPLLWSMEGRRLTFASEPGSLVESLLSRRPPLNEGFIGEFLSARVASAQDTFWKDVFRVPPGGAVTLRDGQVREWMWYEEPFEDLGRLSDQDHVDRFSALFDQALSVCLADTSPAAIHLSGGLDSSSVLCRALELSRSGRIASPIRAVTVRYPGEPHDESTWSTLVERHAGITAHVVGDGPYDFDAAKRWSATTLHLPVRPNALGPTIAVCASMRQCGERVLLTGEGGDDWLTGSRAHWPDLLLAGQLRSLIREAVVNGASSSLLSNVRAMIRDGVGPLLSTRHASRLTSPFLDPDGSVPAWIRPEWAEAIGLRERWRPKSAPRHLHGFAQKRRVAAMAPIHRAVTFEPVMALAASYGVELRHPFHDLRLIRFLMGASGGMLQRRGMKKFLLREAMRGTLPEPVRLRTDKAHFALPMIAAVSRYAEQHPPRRWSVVERGWVDERQIVALVDEHRAWRREGLAGPAPNTALGGLWHCVALDIWLSALTGSALAGGRTF